MPKRALITGITGQDGSHLAELLMKKGYEVHGIMRRSSSFNTGRIDHFFQDEYTKDRMLFLHHGDLTDASSLSFLLRKIKPHEVYNLAAQSHVRVSFDTPEYTANVVALGCVRLLEAIRETDIECKMYQASSSEMFGSSPPPQNEKTPFVPCSPYATAKLLAYWQTVTYRKGYGMFACNGILFNHEGERRGETFVTRKITVGVANILAGRQNKLHLGNLEPKRDWGYAPDFVEAMWMMLQQDKPDDYVISTGESHSVREFVELAFHLVGLDWKKYIEIDQRYFRPNEVSNLQGDYSKAKRQLGWEPKTSFRDLVYTMLKHDLDKMGLGNYLKERS